MPRGCAHQALLLEAVQEVWLPLDAKSWTTPNPVLPTLQHPHPFSSESSCDSSEPRTGNTQGVWAQCPRNWGHRATGHSPLVEGLVGQQLPLLSHPPATGTRGALGGPAGAAPPPTQTPHLRRPPEGQALPPSLSPSQPLPPPPPLRESQGFKAREHVEVIRPEGRGWRPGQCQNPCPQPL